MINQHVWSIDTFISNNHGERLSKNNALNMLWNIYAILTLNNEHNKPVLSFQTTEMMRGRLQQLINIKEDIKEKILNLLPNIIKYIPDEELIKLRGILGHLYRIHRSFNNDISNNLSIIFTPLILNKLNNFIPFPDSLVNFPEKPSISESTSSSSSIFSSLANNEYNEKRKLYDKQIKDAARDIEQNESKGIGKKRLYEKIFYDSSTLNIGDFILRTMIILLALLFPKI
eukprot:jgi/Orpsp1_1/1184293/evm.model.c7180000088954.2